MKRFILMNNSASPKGRAKDFSRNYRHIAIVEIEGENWPKMISERAKGVIRIVKDIPCIYVGKTEKSEGRRILNRMKEIVEGLNSI